MPTQMWFGNEIRMQQVPAPSAGMQATHVGYGEDLQYQNGRKGVVRSMQVHKEYNMDFPIQEAAGLSGLDVFGKYASGFYGDLDSYPLFFANPMHYDQNMMPEAWASPGLYRRGWAGIAEDRARTLRNNCPNPSVEINTTGYTAVAGTSGTAAGLRVSTTKYAGTWSYEVTWSVATSAVSGGATIAGGFASAAASYGAMTHVNSSKIQRVGVSLEFLNGSDVQVGTSPVVQVVLAANTWTEISVPAFTAPATTVTCRIRVVAVAGTSGANWAIGDKLRVDGNMTYLSSDGVPPAYFDGDSINSIWTSDVGLSPSEQQFARNIPTISTTAANIYNMPINKATWNIITDPNLVPAPGAPTTSRIPYALIPIPPGYTLHIGYSGAVTGTGRVVVRAYNSPETFVSDTVLTPLSETGATRMNATVSGASAQYVKVFLQRTDYSASSVTVTSIMAQLWPTGTSPNLSGNHVEGKGHRGLKFTDTPKVESYVIVDPFRNVPVHYKGMSTVLIEAQDKG